MTPLLRLTGVFAERFHYGSVFSIMAFPIGPMAIRNLRVAALQPGQTEFHAMRRNEISMAEFRRMYEEKLGQNLGALAPGVLTANDVTMEQSSIVVASGDTLCCGCSIATAEKGLCHRVWAVPFLLAAGWEVRLDGKNMVQQQGSPGNSAHLPEVR